MYRSRFSLRGIGHGLFFSRQDSGTAKDLKARMSPGFQQVYMIGSDFTFREKQGKDFGSEDFFQIFKLNSRGDLKKTFFRETTIRNQNMAVGVKPQKISKGLDGDDRPGD